MTRIERVIKDLEELYEFGEELKKFRFVKKDGVPIVSEPEAIYDAKPCLTPPAASPSTRVHEQTSH